MYAKIIEGEIETIANLRREYPGTSFPPALPDEYNGWVKVTDAGGAPGQKKAAITHENGVFTQTYEINRDAIAAHLSRYREQKITEGITVNGLTLGGDDKTMLRIAGARIKADSDPTFTTKWNGSTVLNATQIIAISDAMLAHVDKCFDVYGALNPADYDTIAELEAAFDTAYNEA